MSDAIPFIELGFRHIVARDAADHLLFLLALAAIYRRTEWRALVWVATAFTAGHSLTLVLSVTGLLVLPRALVEFLIPVTIVLTGLENVARRARIASGGATRHRPIAAAVFGLVHGAGFADYLRSLFVDRIAWPLFGFNVGIEMGQLLVLLLAFLAFAIVDRTLARAPVTAIRRAPFQARLVGVSAAVSAVAATWAWARWP
ncbi:MAG: HupE/UreJ family protein [Gemmatimonadaceae bacterium]